MNNPDENTEESRETMDPQFHREMVKLGWRLPQTLAEVRMAEDYVAQSFRQLPARLRDAPRGGPRENKREGIVAKRLRDTGSARDPADRSRDQSKPPPERER